MLDFWIESHSSLARHPKTKRLSRLLNISCVTAVGHLHYFWWWAGEYAQDGCLVRYDATDIADAACWEGEPDTFLSGLLSAGFIDELEDGLHIHDWYDYAGKLIERRKKDAERKKNYCAIHEEIQRKSDDSPAESARNQTVPNQTVPNQTVPNQTVPNQTTPNLIPSVLPQGGDEARAARQGNDIGHLHHNSADIRFDDFWEAYPRKVGKEAARKAWKRLRHNAELLEKILAAVESAKSSGQWQRESGRYIPNPSTWLNQGRWDDELTLPPSAAAPDSFGEDFDILNAIRRKAGRE